MARIATIAVVFLVALSLPALGQIIDPNVGFCPVGGNCFTATGSGGETILISGGTTFQMESNGAPDATAPWYMIVAIPEATDGAVTFTPIVKSGNSAFTQIGTTTDAGDYLPTSTTDLYAFCGAACGNLAGNNSLNATNMFGAQEQTAFGSTPADFEVFVYAFTPGFNGLTPYIFVDSGLPAGTFLAAIAQGPPGCDPTATSGNNQCNQQFSTPFTTAGLIDNVPTNLPENRPVPEPASLALLGAGLLAVGGMLRRTVK